MEELDKMGMAARISRTMRLLALNQTFAERDDVVFRHKPLGPAIWTIALTALLAWDIYGVVHPPMQGIPRHPDNGLRFFLIVLGLFLLLAVYLSQHAWRAALHPTNWLMRIRGDRVLIKFRNFENWQLSEADRQIIELDRQEIAYVRRGTIEQQVGLSGGKGNTQTLKTLEMSLQNVDLATIDAALQEECSKRVPQGTTTLFFPVELENDLLRIKWDGGITPGLKRALAELGKLVPVKEEARTVKNFTPAALKKLSDEEQRKRIKELAVRDPMAAIRVARELYGCTLAEAKQIVEGSSAD